MSDLDELMAQAAKVSELVQALEHERREHGKTRDRLNAELAINKNLHRQIDMLRERTPALGTPVTPQTDPNIRRTREHG